MDDPRAQYKDRELFPQNDEAASDNAKEEDPTAFAAGRLGDFSSTMSFDQFRSNNLSDAMRMDASPSEKSHWAPNLLLECAKAVSNKDVTRVQQLMGVLNELCSPYGDCDQRMASCFLQALFCKITGTGPRCHRVLNSAAEKNYSFDSMRKMMLKFQEVSPWTTFGHVAANGVIMEAIEGELRVHIVDLSNTFCTQWPTFLEALATRPEGAPHLRFTTIMMTKEESAMKVMKEIGNRLQKFARLMGVPFEFKALQEPDLEKLGAAELEVQPGEALVINCINSLNHVHEQGVEESQSPREKILRTFHSMSPKIVTLVEQEVDLTSPEFLTCFYESLRFYSLVFGSLEESFPRTSNERLMLERVSARNIVSILSCEESDNSERQQKYSQWAAILHKVGFKPGNFSDDVRDDVRALLKRYKEGWGFTSHENITLFLTWKDQSTVFASAWKPC